MPRPASPPGRRPGWTGAPWLLCLSMLAGCLGPDSGIPTAGVELLIRGGLIHDGSGADATIQDVGVSGDRIVYLGDAASAGVRGLREIDARGLVVSPGFIDPHAHARADLVSSDVSRRQNAHYLLQGVTTVIIGNDGFGTFEIAESRAVLETGGVGTNVGLLVGFGAVRGTVIGASDQPPGAAEQAEMAALVTRAMEEGALGLSSGLFYAPQSFASTEEVVALARVAAAHGGVYDTHMRDEASYTIGLLGSIDEVLRIAEEADIAVNISHIKALGVDVWGQSTEVVERIRAARTRGLRVTADQYPYEASGSSIQASLLPGWAQVGGREAMLGRLDDPSVRPRLRAEMRDNLRRRNGAAALLITGGGDPALRGRTLVEIADERGVDPIDAALEIIRDGDASVSSFTMHEDDITTFMQAEFVMTGSDGSDGHPRKYGTFTRKLRTYVLDDEVIPMSRMVQASSAQPARVFGLADRGRIAVGAFADLAIFDPTTVRDEATFLRPRRLATGMRYVLVNGELAVAHGVPTGRLAGRVLRRSPGASGP